MKTSPRVDRSISPSSSSSSLLSGRILLVDDFEPWRRSVCARLSGHKQLQVVGEAIDGVEAVQMVQKLNPDLVLLDIGLPKLNGIEAAKRIVEVVSDVKVLFVTQIKTADVVRTALSNGAQGYLVKADAGRELLPAIEAVLRGETFLSRQLKAEVLAGAADAQPELDFATPVSRSFLS